MLGQMSTAQAAVVDPRPLAALMLSYSPAGSIPRDWLLPVSSIQDSSAAILEV